MDRMFAMEVFVAVAERQSLAAAARSLHLAPSSVTRVIAGLEAHVGARLLTRTTRSVRVTEAGAAFLTRAREILALADDAEREAAGQRTEPRGRLTVTASVTFGRLHVAPLLLEFLRAYPEVTGSLMLADRIVNLAEEPVDVAFRIGPLPDSTLRAKRLGQVRRLLVASPAYLDRRGRPTHPRELADHDVIAFSSLFTGDVWRLREEHGALRVPVRPRLEVNDAATAVASALAGDGISVALSYVVADALRSGALEVVLEPFLPERMPVNAVTTEARLPTARVSRFLEFAGPRISAALGA